MRYFIQLLLALLTVAFMVWAIWQGYLLLNLEQMGLMSSQRSVVIIFSILMLIVAFMLTMAIANIGDKNLRAKQFAFRVDLYEKLLAIYEHTTDAIPGYKNSKLELDIGDLEQQLLLLAPAKVLKAFNDLQSAYTTAGINADAASEARQRLILAMREDLGQPVDYMLRKEFQKMLK
jgi:hypothetical protein